MYNYINFSNTETVEELEGWGNEFSQTLIDIDIRVMPAERISMGTNKSVTNSFSYVIIMLFYR